MQTELPSEWRMTALGDVCEVAIGGTPSRREPTYWATGNALGRPWASIADLKRHEVVTTKEKITDLGARNSNVKLLPEGTVMMSFKLTIGRVARAGTDLYTNEAIAGFLPSAAVDSAFLFNVLPLAAEGGDVDQAVKGKTLNKAKLLELSIPLPPLPEQKKIAEILGSVDEAIRATEAVIEQTRRVKEGLLQELLTKGKYPTLELGEVGDVQLGQQRHPKFATGDNVRPYLRVANVLDGRIDFSDLNSMHFPKSELHKFELRDGDILLNEGQSVNLVGRSAVYRGEVPGLCVQKTLLRYRCGQRLLPNFAQAVFQYWLWSGYFAEVSVQTTSMAHLTGVRFRRLPVPVPPLAEQQRLISVVGSVEESALLARREKDALATLKAGLLQDLLTGKVRVKL